MQRMLILIRLLNFKFLGLVNIYLKINSLPTRNDRSKWNVVAEKLMYRTLQSGISKSGRIPVTDFFETFFNGNIIY